MHNLYVIKNTVIKSIYIYIYILEVAIERGWWEIKEVTVNDVRKNS